MLCKRRHLAETLSSELVGGCIMTNCTCWLQTNNLLRSAAQCITNAQSVQKLFFPPLCCLTCSIVLHQPDVSSSGSPCRRPSCCTNLATSDVPAAWTPKKKQKPGGSTHPSVYDPAPPTGVWYCFFLLFSLTPVSASVSSLVSQYIITVISAREVYIYTTLLPLLPVLNVYLPVGWLFLSSVLHLTSLIYTKRTH